VSLPVLAQDVRSGFVESVHHGSAVALDADGRPVVEVGEPAAPIFPRSANKPFQAAAMEHAGLDLPDHLLALAAASHSGERFHLDGVERILAGAGLSQDDLQNTADLPLDLRERAEWIRLGRGPARLAQNCSGKHAAMLATCAENDWPTDAYRSGDHPVQRQIAATLAELAGEHVAAVGVDGCGAPLLAISLNGLARAASRLATASAGTGEQRVAAAMRAHPEWVGGTGRAVTEVMRAVPGLVAKDGAEAVFVAAMPDGRAVALKIADGGERARVPVLVALLRRLGVDPEGFEELGEPPVFGGGEQVGSIRAVL